MYVCDKVLLLYLTNDQNEVGQQVFYTSSFQLSIENIFQKVLLQKETN